MEVPGESCTETEHCIFLLRVGIAEGILITADLGWRNSLDGCMHCERPTHQVRGLLLYDTLSAILSGLFVRTL